MADRDHADADQVLSRKLRQHLGVNIAFSRKRPAYRSSPKPFSQSAMSIR